MTNNSIISRLKSIRQKDKGGREYIHARDLMKYLGYTNWQNFALVINKAKKRLATTGESAENHFIDVDKMVDIGSNTKRFISDYELSREACRFIALQCDKTKPEVKYILTKYAVLDIRNERKLDPEREEYRAKCTGSYNSLNKTCVDHELDPRQFGRCYSMRDKALTGGLSTKLLKGKLDIPQNKPTADYAGKNLLSTIYLMNALTEGGIKKDNLRGSRPIMQKFREVGEKIRELFVSQGVYIENEMTETDIKQMVKERKRQQKQLAQNTTQFLFD